MPNVFKYHLKKILFIVFCCLGAAVYYTEYKSNKNLENNNQKLNISLDQIYKIKLERNINESKDIIDLVKRNNQWEFSNQSLKSIQPDQNYINDIFDKLTDINFQKVNLNGNENLNQFRFDRSLVKLMVNDQQILEISERKNFEGNAYYKINNQQDIYTSEIDFSSKLLNKIIYFQEKHVFSLNLNDIKKITVKNKYPVLLISDLNKVKAEEIIKRLNNMTVQEYYANSQISNGANPLDEITIEVTTTVKKMRLKLNLSYQDKKLYGTYAELILDDKNGDNQKHKSKYVNLDMTYWEYFSNLKENIFFKGSK